MVWKSPRRVANSKLAVLGTWVATRALGLVSPRLAGAPASTLWFTPWRLPQSDRSRAREIEWLRGAKPFQVAGLKGFVAGDGPVILLVHGWGTRASRLGAFVRPLVEAGYQVIGMDLPAHGSSPGRQTTPFEMADSLLEVARCAGPVHALISHSFGGMVSLLAMERGLKPGRVVLLSPALRSVSVRARFAEMFRLRPPVMDALVTAIDRRFGPEVWEGLDGFRIAHRLATRHSEVPVLIAHDPQDADAPFSDAEVVSRILPGAQLLPVEGPGHHKMLLDETAVAAAVDFVTGLRQGNGDLSILAATAGVDSA